jgi:hypothetical protein
MKKSKTLIGYLTYINEKNKSFRLKHFNDSLKSFSRLFEDVETVSVDNNSLIEVRQQLKESNFDKCFHFSENYFDIALFYVSLWEAKRLAKDYVLFAYDDFIAFPSSFLLLNDAEIFMDKNLDVGCTRITSYCFGDPYFDSQITPKSKNPDAVRHFNTVSNSQLNWSSPQQAGLSLFKKTNWHYTSRPTLWRVSVLEKLLEGIEQIPILQGFEQYACKKFDEFNLQTGVMNLGMMKTTDVSDSARTNELKLETEMNIKISKHKLYEAYQKILKGST